ncbi:hypothetical protein WYO_0168 [Methylobacterium sp. GXF4]|uniref:hypothetical protein n=1 Tax=Methylobacterium sp. GXF4 TaxID=1096546 RepID=UPI0002698C51|nr:hypothetical protein [Methylobacterium sp. GXF4]EIZ87131.1 hypothetical protein WYO_0168 [Methylobacterium sp. GXF4]
MAGFAVDNFGDQKFCAALCDVLQKFIPQNVIIVRVEMMIMPEIASRRLMFWYSLVDEGLKARTAGKPAPEHLIAVNVPMWNTHIDADLILAKFALVR